MKQILFLTLSVMLIFSACSKNDDDKKDESITINGTTYPTVKIGTQTWTTVNYNGDGGMNYNNGANDPAVGKLYTYTELKALTTLPAGWRVPTEADVKTLLATVGTKLDGTDIYTDETSSKKLMSTTGWTNTALTGTNSTGLNLVPTGYAFATRTSNEFSDKGVLASFWTSSTVKVPETPTTYLDYPLLFEVSTDSYDRSDEPAGLRGSIYNTSAYGDGSTTFPAERRSIRFVKDN